MKKITMALCCLFVCIAASSQYPLSQGRSQVNAGFGFSSRGLPVYVGFDHGIHKDVSLGFEASFRGYRERWHEVRYRHNIIGFAGNVNYHFNYLLGLPADEWDFYAGLNVGFFIWSSPHDYHGDNVSGLGLGAQVGARYYFSENVAINLEAGGTNLFAGGKIGVTIKI